MTPLRMPSTGDTQIGATGIEQKRAESCRRHGTAEGGQPASARGGGVSGAELSARQAGVGAVSRRRCASPAALATSGASPTELTQEFRQAVLAQVRRRYADFGPTLAGEHGKNFD